MSSKKVKNKTLKSKDFSNEATNKLKGATGPAGPAGDAGEAGPQGPTGPASPATYTTPSGVRSTATRSARRPWFCAVVRSSAAANQKPPFGIGSLGMTVNGVPRVASATDAEAANFGNQLDFQNLDFGTITALGFHVFQTGENSGIGNPNMPAIKMEIDPNLTATASNFSTMTFIPVNSPSNQWSGYIDATTAAAAPAGNGFQLSGAAGTATGCNISSPCTFTQLQTALGDGGDPTRVLTFSVGKGRNNAWSGAVDGLRLNGTVYDFEPFGVQETTP